MLAFLIVIERKLDRGGVGGTTSGGGEAKVIFLMFILLICYPIPVIPSEVLLFNPLSGPKSHSPSDHSPDLASDPSVLSKDKYSSQPRGHSGFSLEAGSEESEELLPSMAFLHSGLNPTPLSLDLSGRILPVPSPTPYPQHR